MKKSLLIISIFVLSIVISGCGKNSNIKVDMGNYQIILSVNANINNTYTNESVNIDYYNDDEYMITDYNNKEYIYRVNNKIYRQAIEEIIIEDDLISEEESNEELIDEPNLESNECIDCITEITDYTKYSKPTLYLNVLDNITKKKKIEDKEMGIYVYTIYEITIKKDIVNEILQDNELNYNLKNDVKGKVWVNKDEPDKVLQLIFDINENNNNIKINANFVNVDAVNSIKEKIEIYQLNSAK